MLIKEKIENLSNQVAFLVEKNKELQKIQLDYFSNIISLIEKKLLEDINTQDSKSLLEIKNILQKDKATASEEFADDISFLQEQLDAINKIKAIEDPAKAQELFNMVTDKDLEIGDFTMFKEKVNSDFLTAQKELNFLTHDIIEAIENNNVEELKLYLEAIKNPEPESCGCNCDSCGCDDSCDCQEEETSCCSGGHDIFSCCQDNKKKK